MMKSAFPHDVPAAPEYEDQQGMSLRDWFAGQALAHCANTMEAEVKASYCYQIADAMLKEREKNGA
jgi:hypothetical protein